MQKALELKWKYIKQLFVFMCVFAFPIIPVINIYFWCWAKPHGKRCCLKLDVHSIGFVKANLKDYYALCVTLQRFYFSIKFISIAFWKLKIFGFQSHQRNNRFRDWKTEGFCFVFQERRSAHSRSGWANKNTEIKIPTRCVCSSGSELICPCRHRHVPHC